MDCNAKKFIEGGFSFKKFGLKESSYKHVDSTDVYKLNQEGPLL